MSNATTAVKAPDDLASVTDELADVERLLFPMHRAAASVVAIPVVADQRDRLVFRRAQLLKQLASLRLQLGSRVS